MSDSVVEMKDVGRELNNLALTWGMDRVSPQTGFVHYCYHPGETIGNDTIPVLENFIYGYALLRSKIADNVNEAKRLISALLPFQSTQDNNEKGNFPVYLHEFPQSKNRYLGYNLLPVFYRILIEFRTVLGSELVKKLEDHTVNVIEYAVRDYLEEKTPYIQTIKLGASLRAFASLYQNQDYHDRGEQILNKALDVGVTKEWFSPEDIGQILIALQIAYPSIEESPWKHFWEHVIETYHPELGAYIGPSLEEYQYKEEPQVTLYHYAMALFTNNIHASIPRYGSYAISASLIQRFQEMIPSKKYPLKGQTTEDPVHWQGYQLSDCAITAFDHALDKLESRWKGAVPLKILWKTPNGLGSLVSQGGNYQTIRPSVTNSEVSLDYVLSEEFILDDKEKCREVVLALTRNKAHSISINGRKATTFMLGDTITIESDHWSFDVTFQLVEGDADFMGHIMPGNRASQVAIKNENRFEAYDTLLFLRTLRRNKHCRVKVTVKVKRHDEP